MSTTSRTFAGAVLTATALTCAGLSASTAPARTELTAIYTLEDCIEIGLARATRVGNALREEGVASAKVSQVGAQLLPQLGLTGNYTRMDEVQTVEFGDRSMEVGKLDNVTAAAEVTQLLYSGGSVGAALRAARLYRQYAAQSTLGARAALIRDIRLQFYGLLLEGMTVEVERESLEHLRSFVKQTEAKFEAETASEFDLLSARVRMANQVPAVIMATNRLAIARELFRNLLNLDDGDYAVRGEFDLGSAGYPDEAAALRAALTNRPELRQKELQIGMIEQDILAARGDYQPALHAFARYTVSNSDQAGFGSSDWDWQWHWSAGARLHWSLFDGGRRGGRVLEKKLALENAKAEFGDLRRMVHFEVRQAWLELTHSAEVMASAQGNEALAERALRLAAVRHEQGLATYLEYTESNVALSRARLTRLQAQCAYAQALARLRYAVGLDAQQKEIGATNPNE